LSKVKSSPYYFLILSISSGLFFWLGWPVNPFPFFLLFIFVPLLEIEDQLAKRNIKNAGWKFFGYSYLSIFIWNISTTWWVYNSTPEGASFMLVANTFLMCMPLLVFRITKKAGGSRWGYFSLVVYWITFEYIHLSWDLSWPWLTLGNAFAMFPEMIQWYEYTGVAGGTLYILITNLIFFYLFFKSYDKLKRIFWLNLGLTCFFLLLPGIYSLIIYYNYQEIGEDVEIVLLQPNIDPYNEKFAGSENFIPHNEQVKKFMDLSTLKLGDQTRFLLWPETAIDYVFNEEQIRDYAIFDEILDFKNNFPQLSLLTGITSYSVYKEKALASATARYRADLGYHDVFNTALFIDDNGNHKFYHKSKLVPGVEIMPYPKFFQFLSQKTIDLGGATGSLGSQDYRTIFKNSKNIKAAPSICYESVYGDFMSLFVRNGANFIFIITNDGWWGNTPGHRQHFHYARLRAVETRRSIARSANTGISGFINQRGDVIQRSEYWVQDVLKETIKANTVMTVYGEHGDYLARTAAWLSVFIFLAAIVKSKTRK
jgi:apolipoprotein N-acyltransferase